MLALAISTVQQEATGYTIAAPLPKPTSLNYINADIDISIYHRSPDLMPTVIEKLSAFRKNEPLFGVVERQTTPKSMYDLGIGKNKPVVVARRSSDDDSAATSAAKPRSVLEATQYWNEHQSVREYPCPQTNVDIFAAAKPAKKVLPVVHPTRHSYDELNILQTDHDQSHQNKPIMVRSETSAPVQLDVNTAWVEMLIHHEQLKSQGLLAVAAAN